jgi:poly(3-hydroxybutyrate) depolymerase
MTRIALGIIGAFVILGVTIGLSSQDQVAQVGSAIPEPTISENQPETASACGDSVCSVDETKTSCPLDCDELSCRPLYQTLEDICAISGWKKGTVNVSNVEREYMWKAPRVWKKGVIIVLHGGEGVDANICAATPKGISASLTDTLRGVPMVDFGRRALEEGFAVISLNSTYNRVLDENGSTTGKRWDSFASADNGENIDIAYIQKMIDEVIPKMRPWRSSKAVYMTGISNGGFMTTLASTHLSGKVTAFAPVSAGDPYGTYIDAQEDVIERKCGPGTFIDSSTDMSIHQTGACKIEDLKNDIAVPVKTRVIPFKQFHHNGDSGVDVSCMQKNVKLLETAGYKNDVTLLLGTPGMKRTIESHFWQPEYNESILTFFKKYPR